MLFKSNTIKFIIPSKTYQCQFGTIYIEGKTQYIK